MGTADNGRLTVAERLRRLLQNLGIERAHFAAGAYSQADCAAFVVAYPELVASVALVSAGDAEVYRPLASRLLVVGGDSGPIGQRIGTVIRDLPAARRAILTGYSHSPWSDVAADHPQELGAALSAFLSEKGTEHALLDVPQTLPREGEVAGISYRLRGSGPPLVLLPMGLAPSQWDPILPALDQHHTTVVVGGPVLAPAGLLERRAAAPGFRRVVGSLVDALELRPGELLLDVGCGTGGLDRWLLRRYATANRIVGVDINRYLLREAEALVRNEGFEEVMEFREGDAEKLPFADDVFDVGIAVTLLEEVNADQALSELVRVTRPGGRVGVMVRGSDDLPQWVNAPLDPLLKAKVEAPGAPPRDSGKAAEGCADASLYRRARAAGLVSLQMFPQLYGYDAGPFLADLETGIEVALSREEARQWREAVAQARADGIFCVARPCHCVVGTKP